MNDDELLTPQELAKKLKISTAYVYKMVRMKTLPFFHIGKVIRFSPTAVAAWLESTAGGTYHRDVVRRGNGGARNV